jgi:hypothetical protein
MRQHAPVVVVLGFLSAGLAMAPASAEEGYRHGRIRMTEPGVTLQRATETGAEEAVANMPFLPGDRIWTDEGGRADFQFPDGTVVRLDRRSKLDYAGHEEGQEERIVLRLWSGSLILRTRGRDSVRFEVETPAGMVQALERGVYRVDVEAGAAHVAVYEGEAALDDTRNRVQVRAGEQTWGRWGERPAEPQPLDRDVGDDFSEWDGEQEAREARAAGSQRYLPDELGVYASDFDQNGAWYNEPNEGYVWVPSVMAGWRPYWNGHWEWTPYGWTWVPYENWGWAPFHYGRWGFAAELGWYWIPGRVWGAGWVSWAVGDGYVGWCPLGRHDRPITAWGEHRGFAVPRGFSPARGHAGLADAWTVVRSGDLGAPDVARRRVAPDRIGLGGLRVADSPYLRPTRDARGLRQAEAVPRAIRTRPTPGDYVRELAVDNQTTIPSFWLRRPGTVPRSEDIPRYRQGQTSEGGGSAERPPGAVGRPPRGTQEGVARTGGETPTPYQARPVTPTPSQPRLGTHGDRAEGARPGTASDGSPAPQAVPRGSGAVSRPQGGAESDRPRGSAEGYRPQGGGDSGRPRGSAEGYRPQGGSQGYRPQGSAEGSRAPAGGGSGSVGGSHPAPRSQGQARPSGGGSSSHGAGGHAVSRSSR